MSQLILNMKCAIPPPLLSPFFVSRAANKKNQNSIFQCSGDRSKVLKFKCEHRQSTLEPPNTNPVNGKMSKMPVRFQMAFSKTEHWHQPPEIMAQLVTKLE